eukprot:CAMPEP_0185257464 /NCGR_PEP_ID=MMETSP1359-20130426/6529_1 /TAXON_ID=552665 /ORGANISM="Bigelowiella longifila, Strain CCMP242" /LENGTH=53 /DNA_ID=CAMNT_0027842571 /DNA_START=264 /DNA_END=422 /DNA_ORIENTATION=-
MSSQLKEKLDGLREMKGRMEKAEDPKRVCEEIIKRLSSAKDPLVKGDECDNEW